MKRSKVQELEEMRAWMRENGVLHARMGDMEITLDPVIAAEAEPPIDPEDKSVIEAEINWRDLSGHSDMYADPMLYPNKQVPDVVKRMADARGQGNK